MKKAIYKVKQAVASKAVITALTHYLIQDGYIYATDGRMTAAAPLDDDRTYLVPAEELEKCVARMEEPKVEILENQVKVSSGRMRATINTLHPDSFHLLKPEGKKTKVPKELLGALRQVRPFISANATQSWALCAYLAEDGIYATNNVSIIKADCKDIKIPGLIPSWAIDYILAREEELTHMAWGDGNSLSFFWKDKSWMRTQLIEAKFHEKVIELVAASDKAKWELTGSWLEAYEDAVALSDDSLIITPTKMIGGRGQATVEVDIKTPAVKNETYWDPRFLGNVVKAARYWEPGKWPNPTPFKGEGVVGLILGRRP